MFSYCDLLNCKKFILHMHGSSSFSHHNVIYLLSKLHVRYSYFSSMWKRMINLRIYSTNTAYVLHKWTRSLLHLLLCGIEVFLFEFLAYVPLMRKLLKYSEKIDTTRVPLSNLHSMLGYLCQNYFFWWGHKCQQKIFSVAHMQIPTVWGFMQFCISARCLCKTLSLPLN